MTDVVFVTGNPEKAENFARHMGVRIPHQAVELDEIQTLDAHELIEHKVRQAYTNIGRPVLVEDVAFSYAALGDLPGPFIKFFLSSEDSAENLCRLLDGFDDRRAVARCTFGYFDGENTNFFSGELRGKVSQHPRGNGGHGFDRVFEPDGFAEKTAAELNPDEYDTYYASIKPFDKVRNFLETL